MFGLLVVAVLAVIGSVAYVAVNPGKNERFTEFYVLGPDGTADGYPLELRVGEEATVILGIVNREHERAAYRVELAIDGERIDFTVDGGKRSAVEVELAHEEKWEEEVSFASRESGEDRKVEFILYKDGTAYFEAPLHLWVDVVD